MILIRDADLKTEPVKEWLEANIARNDFDPKVLEYPGLSVLAAYNEQVISYTPIHPVVVIESVGINGKASNNDIATALVETVRTAAYVAYKGNCREIHFLTSDPLTTEGAKKLGFEEKRVMRLRL